VSAHALAHPAPARPARRTAIVAAASALGGALAILALIVVVNLAGGSGAAPATPTYTAPGHAFSVAVPAGWSALDAARLGRAPGSPAAALRRADGRGIVVVRRIAPLKGDLRTVARALTTDLRARVAGFRLVSARLGRVRAGGAFLYTFVRGAQGTVQSLAITRVHGMTYRIDSLVRGDSADVARQAGAIVGSFGP
jgi:hypothetical protein